MAAWAHETDPHRAWRDPDLNDLNLRHDAFGPIVKIPDGSKFEIALSHALEIAYHLQNHSNFRSSDWLDSSEAQQVAARLADEIDRFAGGELAQWLARARRMETRRLLTVGPMHATVMVGKFAPRRMLRGDEINPRKWPLPSDDHWEPKYFGFKLSIFRGRLDCREVRVSLSLNTHGVLMLKRALHGEQAEQVRKTLTGGRLCILETNREQQLAGTSKSLQLLTQLLSNSDEEDFRTTVEIGRLIEPRFLTAKAVQETMRSVDRLLIAISRASAAPLKEAA